MEVGFELLDHLKGGKPDGTGGTQDGYFFEGHLILMVMEVGAWGQEIGWIISPDNPIPIGSFHPADSQRLE